MAHIPNHCSSNTDENWQKSKNNGKIELWTSSKKYLFDSDNFSCWLLSFNKLQISYLLDKNCFIQKVKCGILCRITFLWDPYGKVL